MDAESFLYGTAGWSYDDWQGPFYEAGTPKNQFLRRYAEEFPAVEVDSTYYRIPSAKMTEGWDRSTPDGFVFSPKMVGEVTHERFLEDCEEPVERYLEDPLAEELLRGNINNSEVVEVTAGEDELKFEQLAGTS